MVATVGGVRISFDADTGNFNSGVTEASRRLSRFEQSANRSLGSIKSAFALGGLGAGLGFGASLAGAVKLNQELASIAKTAREVGLSFERIQEVKFAAKLGGVSDQDFTSGLQNAAKLLEEAGRQENSLSKLFAANNLSLKDREGRLISINDLLSKGADLVKNAGSGAAKVEIASMLGLSREWVRTLENGSVAFNRTATEARNAGAVINSDIIARAEQFEKAWDQATTRWSTALKAQAASIMPDLVKLAELAFSAVEALDAYTTKSTIAYKLENGIALNLKELAYAIELARSKGSPIDPSWITQQERLLELQRETNRARALSGLPATSSTATSPGPKTVIPAKETSTGRDPFEGSILSLQKRIALLDADTRAVGLSESARARLRVVAELEVAATRANAEAGRKNVEVTEEQRRVINGLADAYAGAAARMEAARSPLQQWIRESQDLNRRLEEFGAGALDNISDEFTDVVTGSKKVSDAFKDMADSIIKDLTRILIRKAIGGAIGAMFGGPAGMGIGSSLGGMLGGASSSYMMGGVQVPLFAKGGVFNHGMPITAFARGGVVNSPITFPFKNGTGLMGEAGPEAIMPLTRGSDGKLGVQALGGGGGIVNNVQVINNSSAQITENRRQNDSGGVDLVVMIDDLVAGQIGSGQSKTNTALQNRYGLNPTVGMV